MEISCRNGAKSSVEAPCLAMVEKQQRDQCNWRLRSEQDVEGDEVKERTGWIFPMSPGKSVGGREQDMQSIT